MWDRHLKSQPERTSSGIKYRLETLLGFTGAKMAKYRPTWTRCVLDTIEVVWKPHIFLALLYVFSDMLTDSRLMFKQLRDVGLRIWYRYQRHECKKDRCRLWHKLTPERTRLSSSAHHLRSATASRSSSKRARTSLQSSAACLASSSVGISTIGSPAVALGATMVSSSPRCVSGLYTSPCPSSSAASFFLATPSSTSSILLLVRSDGLWPSLLFLSPYAHPSPTCWSQLTSRFRQTVCVYAYLNNVEPARQGEMSSLLNLFRVLGGVSLSFFW